MIDNRTSEGYSSCMIIWKRTRKADQKIRGKIVRKRIQENANA
jgi:hypothetical protein